VPLAEEWVEGTKRFANKLWNAGRFALSHLDGTARRPAGPRRLALEDRWILSRLEAVHAEVDDRLRRLRLAASPRLYHFAWDELADWYLEAVKVRIYGDDAARADRPGGAGPSCSTTCCGCCTR
jgi:valyl-tRNA synthetase